MRKFLRRRAGQSMVEFAVLAPVFFLLLLGTIDLGRSVYTYNAISNAAREGARAAVPYDSPLPTTDSVVAAVQSTIGGRFSHADRTPCAAVGAGGESPECLSPSKIRLQR